MTEHSLNALAARVDRLEALEEIRQLTAKYAVALDMRDLDSLVNLFVDDVRVPGRLTGRAALRRWYDAELRHDLLGSAHGVLGHVIDVHDAEHATGLVYSRNDLETASAWVIELLAYLDVYERRDRRWYFVRRTPLFWYESDITDPPVGPRKMRWPGTTSHEGAFHDAFPSWAEFHDADPGRFDAPVPAPAAVGDWIRTLRRGGVAPKVNSTGRAEDDPEEPFEMTDQPDAFTETDDQREFRRAVRAFLEHYSPESEVRRVMDSPDGYDPAVWRAMADQLNLQGLAIPEEYGGEGFGCRELALVLEEMGAALLPGPYFASAVLAAGVLLAADDEPAKRRHLPRIASGATIATLAFTEGSGRWDADAVATRAEPNADGWTITGTKHYVLDGLIADLILVAARTESNLGVFLVEETATLDRRPQSTLDATRRQAVVEFAGTPATRLGITTVGLEHGLARAAAGLANEQVGGAQRCLDQAVGYAKVRHQFGKPIGSFQAIRHKCADLMLDIECARGAAQYAAHAADAFPAEFPAAAALAKAHSSEVYARAAAANIQLHGGIGFTWEHPAHMYFKRAKSSALLLGDADHHRRLLADRVGI